MHSKRHGIKGTARAQNSRIAETAGIAVGVRRAQIVEDQQSRSGAATTTLQEARQGIRHDT